jgi:hypothetical protein
MVTGYLSLGGGGGWGGGLGLEEKKRKKEKRRQREVEKKVIWRLLMGGDKHNEKSKIKSKKTGRK